MYSPETVKIAILYIFNVNFTTGYINAEFLGTKGVTYLLCFHLKENRSESLHSYKVMKPKVTTNFMKTGICLASFLDSFWMKVVHFINNLLNL